LTIYNLNLIDYRLFKMKYQIICIMKTIIKIFIFFCVTSFAVSKTSAQLNVSVTVAIAPPELPVYVQPPCPVDGYIWEPGYWAYDDVDGYYWVPGVWVAPPEIGYLWTPCYWGFEGGYYGFYQGYWGLQVGFYGGINYGYGYGGYGYGGGRWEGDHFRYNTAVVNVNTTVIHNTYVDNTVVNNTYVNNHTSFNGPGGVTARPRPEEQAAMKESHIPPTTAQVSHQQVARKDPNQFVKVNNGHPAAAVMDKVGGRPLDEHGHVATNSTLGRANPGGNPAVNGSRPTTNANSNRPATNVSPNRPATNVSPNRPATNANPGRPVISQSRQRTQPQPQSQQRVQPQPQQRAQLQRQQRPAQPPQRMQQNRPSQQPRPQAPVKPKQEKQ